MDEEHRRLRKTQYDLSFDIDDSQKKKQNLKSNVQPHKVFNIRNFVIIIGILLFIFYLLIFKSTRSAESHEVLNYRPGGSKGILLPIPKTRALSSFTIDHPNSNYNQRVFCKIFNDHACKSYYIADNIDLFWVIAPFYRYNMNTSALFIESHLGFKSYIQSFGLPFLTIEAIKHPNDYLRQSKESKEAKEYCVTKPNNEPYDMQVYYYNVSYIHENLVNVAIRKLKKLADWEYVAWIDSHQLFENSYWWEDAIYKTERYGSVHLFGGLKQLGKKNETLNSSNSILRISLYTPDLMSQPVVFGNALAITRKNYNAIKFIYDECIAASCDFAYILSSVPAGYKWDFRAPNYFKNSEGWVNHTRSVFKNRRTFVRGNLLHMHQQHAFPDFELQQAIEKYGFNASTDLARDDNFTIYITNGLISGVLDWIITTAKPDNHYS